MHIGENILFLDLSLDPYLFKGPKGDKQVRNWNKLWISILSKIQNKFISNIAEIDVLMNYQMQSETYRKMEEVTEDYWEGRYFSRPSNLNVVHWNSLHSTAFFSLLHFEICIDVVHKLIVDFCSFYSFPRTNVLWLLYLVDILLLKKTFVSDFHPYKLVNEACYQWILKNVAINCFLLWLW